jgi:pimeloyl-ACP methyl ester carboxylesterase
MNHQEFTIQCNDVELFYRVYGKGPELLLLHGFFASGEMWTPYIPILSRQFRLIIPDLRGHGRSTNPSGRFTHRQAALDIYALLDWCNINTIYAVGFSSGGMTLLHMATQQPERVKVMVLCGTTSYFPEQVRVVMRTVSMPNESNPDLGYFRTIHVRGDAQIQALHEQFKGFGASYDDMNFTRPYLSTITARTLIVHGDRDWAFPVDIPVEIYGAIPKSSLYIVPNTDHDLARLWRVPAEGIQDAFDPVLEFLRDAKDSG